MRQQARSHASRGFTIVELLVTVVIVSILASVAFPMTELAYRRNKEQELKRNLSQIRDALDAYKAAADKGHIALQPGETGYPATLELLVDGVVDAKDPDGKKLHFLRRMPVDPFAASGWGKRSYASSAKEPKEGADVYDVYSLSEEVGMNGVPYAEW